MMSPMSLYISVRVRDQYRSAANEKIAADPGMVDLMSSSNSGFDAERMAYGGFKSLVLSPNTNTG